MTWQIYTVITVLGLSVSVLLQRVLLHKNKTDPVAYSALFQLITALIITVFAIYKGISFEGFASIWLVALMCVLFFGVGTVVYAKTLQYVEASAFSVLFATQAIWIMVLGILLFNESITIIFSATFSMF